MIHGELGIVAPHLGKREGNPGGIGMGRAPTKGSQIPKKKKTKKKGKRREFLVFQGNPGFYLGWAGAFGGGHEESVLSRSCRASGDILRENPGIPAEIRPG